MGIICVSMPDHIANLEKLFPEAILNKKTRNVPTTKSGYVVKDYEFEQLRHRAII